MINREMKSVSLLTYDNSIDDYGQKRQNTPVSTTIEMVCKLYNQSNTQNMRYVDVDMIGITKYSLITNSNVIKIDNVNYSVKYVIPSGKYYQVLLKKND